MSNIDYSDKIPNNVNLANDRTLQRALEHWQPRFLEWWREMGPNDFAPAEGYLRTAGGGGGRTGLGTLRQGEDPRIPRGLLLRRSHRRSHHRLRGLLRPAGVAA